MKIIHRELLSRGHGGWWATDSTLLPTTTRTTQKNKCLSFNLLFLAFTERKAQIKIFHLGLGTSALTRPSESDCNNPVDGFLLQ